MTSSFGYDGTFLPARPRKKRKNRPGKAPGPSLSVMLERATQELITGGWLDECKNLLRDSLLHFASTSPSLSVLCLGLGSPQASRDARAQLAFLLAVCDDLSIPPANVAVYDPVFSDEDLRLLAEREINCLTENRHACYAFDAPTIVFMPHCDLQLYENLIRENWSRERLSSLLLIANRFSEYTDSHPSHKLSKESPCVARLTCYLTSRPLPTSPLFPTSFNNTSIQFIHAGALPTENAFWELPRPPDPDEKT